MSHLAPTNSSLQFTKRVDQDTSSHKSQWQSPHSVSIDILDDDSLLNIFYVYRPLILGEDEDDEYCLLGGSSRWVLEHWWFKLTHVCQRWRGLVLGSPTYLGLCLVCTHGTPVMDMLTHSPPLPLVIDYLDDITTDDEGGIVFALEQRDRVRRIRIQLPIPKLQKLITISEEYPILEYLIIGPSIEHNSSVLRIPGTLQAPHLRHLSLTGFALPIGSRLLTTAMGLVTLNLRINHPSTYFQPNTLLQWLSFMPQLETIVIILIPVRNFDVERQPTRMPITRLTLPNLRQFGFQGASVYMEAIVHRITTPRLEKLQISFFNQLTFSVPHLRQFMSRTENLMFASARFNFSSEEVNVEVYPRGETKKYVLQIRVFCWHLDWQLSSVAQIFNSLSQMFSAVEGLSVEHDKHRRSTEEHNEVDRSEWSKFIMSFSNAKTLGVDLGLFEELSYCLPMDSPLRLLPLPPKIRSEQIRKRIFTHSSRCHKHPFQAPESDPPVDNEECGHLGDQVFALAVTDAIQRSYPHLRVGPASKLRDRIKHRDILAEICMSCGLHMRLDLSESQAGDLRASRKVQVDIFKVYVGCVYRDQGAEVVSNWLILLLRPYVEAAYRSVREDHLLLPDTEVPRRLETPTTRYVSQFSSTSSEKPHVRRRRRQPAREAAEAKTQLSDNKGW